MNNVYVVQLGTVYENEKWVGGLSFTSFKDAELYINTNGFKKTDDNFYEMKDEHEHLYANILELPVWEREL